MSAQPDSTHAGVASSPHSCEGRNSEAQYEYVGWYGPPFDAARFGIAGTGADVPEDHPLFQGDGNDPDNTKMLLRLTVTESHRLRYFAVRSAPSGTEFPNEENLGDPIRLKESVKCGSDKKGAFLMIQPENGDTALSIAHIVKGGINIFVDLPTNIKLRKLPEYATITTFLDKTGEKQSTKTLFTSGSDIVHLVPPGPLEMDSDRAMSNWSKAGYSIPRIRGHNYYINNVFQQSYLSLSIAVEIFVELRTI